VEVFVVLSRELRAAIKLAPQRHIVNPRILHLP
jgi:hypothetical protein